MAAAKHGISCKDASIYISPFFPCERCARGIIQAGINIVNIDNSQENIRYKGDISMEMFNEAGIKVNIFS
jgi:deoxycytidylate deaminase